ncbi:MAG: hypothetical protein K8R69_05835, partial [Deltaproteobacteria bacterium]|nr:hypothetical protein [Deltaproteobacteria bacterium]
MSDPICLDPRFEIPDSPQWCEAALPTASVAESALPESPLATVATAPNPSPAASPLLRDSS